MNKSLTAAATIAVIVLLAGCAPAADLEPSPVVNADPTAADLAACEEIAEFTEEFGFRSAEQARAMLDSTVELASPSLAPLITRWAEMEIAYKADTDEPEPIDAFKAVKSRCDYDLGVYLNGTW